MSRRNKLVLRDVAVQDNIGCLAAGNQLKSQQSLKSAITIGKPRIVPAAAPTENKLVNAVPSTSEVACQTAVTVSGHYEDPKLKLADLKSPRPTSNFLRRKATKLLKQLEDSLNESFELSLDHSRTELELEEVENEVKLIEEYEIGPEDLEEEEDNEDQENKEE